MDCTSTTCSLVYVFITTGIKYYEGAWHYIALQIIVTEPTSRH